MGRGCGSGDSSQRRKMTASVAKFEGLDLPGPGVHGILKGA